MELVQAFNAELSSLYEVKPPISKAKMSTITKTAIKGIKMYKHIVQSVERFIAKCRPEYKVPGLYVVDSIVRQSRHQFGPDKDVFGPRFTRNFPQTFQSLFLTCPVDDKPKIVRVLNLWQRNGVFTSEVIQPLLDIAAHPNTNLAVTSPSLQQQQSGEGQSDVNTEASIVMHLHHLATSLGLSKTTNGSSYTSAGNGNGDISSSSLKFNKKLLDFDYGDDDDEEQAGETPTEAEPPTSAAMAAAAKESASGVISGDLSANPLALNVAQNLLLNPELLQKLQQSISMQTKMPGGGVQSNFDSSFSNSPYFGSNSLQNENNLQSALKENSNYNVLTSQNDMNSSRAEVGYNQSRSRSRSPTSDSRKRDAVRYRDRSNYKDKDERFDYRYGRERDRSRNERRTFRSRSKSPRNGSDHRQTIEAPISEKDREREKERERRKKGLPPVKKGYVTICSTTLWLGHLPKSTSEVNISDALGEFGTINTIDLISARGCAYVCMNRRQDAYRALQNLKNLKLNGSNMKMAWAPGKGMKDKEFKDYWDVDLGVSYIPEEKLNNDVDIELLEDGGCIDEDTIPEFIKELQKQRKQQEKEQLSKNADTATAPPLAIPASISAPVQPVSISVSIPTMAPMSVPVPMPPFAMTMGPPPINHLNPLTAPPPHLLANGAPLLQRRMNPMHSIPPPPPPPIQTESDDDVTIIEHEGDGVKATSDTVASETSTSTTSGSPIKPLIGAPITALGPGFPTGPPPPHAALFPGGPPLNHRLPPPGLLPAPGHRIPWLGGPPHPHQSLLPPNMAGLHPPPLGGQPIRNPFFQDGNRNLPPFRHERPMRPALFEVTQMDPSLMHPPPRLNAPPFNPMNGPPKFFSK